MDETAVCLYQAGRKGNVFLDKNIRAVQNVSRGKRRTFLTHVAFTCDDPLVQPVLPQIVLANERTIPARMLADLEGSCPPNVYLLRRRSAWIDAELCARIIKLLAFCIAPRLGDRQAVLLFDACRQHLARCVFAACQPAGIWPLVVPASLTWLLQPLDTHTFLAHKGRLRAAYQNARIRAVDGEVGVAGLLQCVYEATRSILQGVRWARSFEENGCGAGQRGLCQRVLKELGWDAPPAVSSSRPSLAQLRLCFPKRARVPEALIWRAMGPAVASDPAAGGEDMRRVTSVASAASVEEVGVEEFARGGPVTRSRTRAAAKRAADR